MNFSKFSKLRHKFDKPSALMLCSQISSVDTHTQKSEFYLNFIANHSNKSHSRHTKSVARLQTKKFNQLYRGKLKKKETF